MNREEVPEIVCDPEICHGQPTLKGTRILVSVILDEIAEGRTFALIEKGYGITPSQLRACVQWSILQKDKELEECRKSLAWVLKELKAAFPIILVEKEYQQARQPLEKESHERTD